MMTNRFWRNKNENHVGMLILLSCTYIFKTQFLSWDSVWVSLGLTCVAFTRSYSDFVFLELCPNWFVRQAPQFSPDSLGASGEVLHYKLQWSPRTSHVVWHFLPFLLVVPIPSPKVPTSASGSQLLHQDSLCPWSCCICWCQSCRIQSQQIVTCFFLKPPASHSPSPPLWDLCVKSWISDYKSIRMTNVFPTLKVGKTRTYF